ncbi:MAG TPA: LysR family transcriptional regulator, partial [Mycobacterium sp.]|nr:LysR family transcriptional regulator [Mycobacterium sp.]
MELRELRYVLAIDKTGNLSRAAEVLHVSQPALSYALRKLERELGV